MLSVLSGGEADLWAVEQVARRIVETIAGEKSMWKRVDIRTRSKEAIAYFRSRVES